MDAFRALLSHKLIRIGLAILIFAMFVFSYALLGSSVNPSPQNMPVVLVMKDSGVKMLDGSELNFGKILEKNLMGSDNAATKTPSPFKWIKMKTSDQALDSLDHMESYGALIIPENFTQQLLSLKSNTPQSAAIETIVSQGKNNAGALVITQGFEKIIAGMNQQFKQQFLGEIKAQGQTLSTEQATALGTPIIETKTIVNAVGPSTANGNAPVTLTQLVWLGALVTTYMQFFAVTNSRKEGKKGFGLLLAQFTSGFVYALIGVPLILLVTSGMIGLDVPNLFGTAAFLFLMFISFFMLQAGIVQWLGIPGIPILILLFFFGLPVLSQPKEFLPAFTQDWFLVWVPFRFSVEGLRDLFFFQKGINWVQDAWILFWIGFAGMSSMVIHFFTRKKAA